MYLLSHLLLKNYCGGSLFAFLSFICDNEFAGIFEIMEEELCRF